MLQKTAFLSFIVLALSGTAQAQEPAKTGPHERVITDLLKVMDEISSVFDTITDVKTAKKAQPKLDGLADRLQDVAKRASKLSKPDPEVDRLLKQKYAKKLQTTMTRFITSARKVSKVPEVQPILRDFGMRLQEIGQAMKKVGQ